MGSPSLPFAPGSALSAHRRAARPDAGSTARLIPSLSLAPEARTSSPLGDYSRCGPGPGAGAVRCRELELLTLGRLAGEEEGLRESALSAHLERAEILEPETFRRIRLGL